MHSLESDKLRLTDFMDLPTLQEIQDSFAAVANVKAIITDADGNVLTSPNPTTEFLKRQQTLAAAEEADPSATESYVPGTAPTGSGAPPAGQAATGPQKEG